MSIQSPRGNRKFHLVLLMALLITLGFVFAVVMKAPTELFVAYVGPVVTITMAFMWGNAQEHKAQAPNPSNL